MWAVGSNEAHSVADVFHVMWSSWKHAVDAGDSFVMNRIDAFRCYYHWRWKRSQPDGAAGFWVIRATGNENSIWVNWVPGHHAANEGTLDRTKRNQITYACAPYTSWRYFRVHLTFGAIAEGRSTASVSEREAPVEPATRQLYLGRVSDGWAWRRRRRCGDFMSVWRSLLRHPFQKRPTTFDLAEWISQLIKAIPLLACVPIRVVHVLCKRSHLLVSWCSRIITSASGLSHGYHTYWLYITIYQYVMHV